MVECAVVDCSNRTPRDSKRDVSFHQLPLKNKPLLKEWLVRIKRSNLPKLSQCHICSEHFEKECFKSCCNLNLWPGGKRKRDLHDDAVPTIFPHQPKKSRRLASERRINKALHEEVNRAIKNWTVVACTVFTRSFNASCLRFMLLYATWLHQN